MILDTNFLIDLKEQDTDAKRKARALEHSHHPLRLPTIVDFEMYISVGKADEVKYKIKDQRASSNLSSSKPAVELTQSIAKLAGNLEGLHQNSDHKSDLGPGDAIIAATGLKLGEAVVTTDDDFEDVDGLSVETY
jgi:predicted nucleic acid-binding protein